MISVVGIGDFCCELVNKFSSYPQYEVYNIDSNIIPQLKNSEDYERNYPDILNKLINDKNEELSVFLDGSESISGIILRFLETYKNRKINLYYIRSDLELVGNLEKLQDKITFSILQEYTRSGLFNKFISVFLRFRDDCFGVLGSIFVNVIIRFIQRINYRNIHF